MSGRKYLIHFYTKFSEVSNFVIPKVTSYSLSTTGLSTITHIYAGRFFYLTTSDGSVYTWNNNLEGELSNYTTQFDNPLINSTETPCTFGKVTGLSGISELTVASYRDDTSCYEGNNTDDLNENDSNPNGTAPTTYDTIYAVGTNGSIKISGYNPQTQQVVPAFNPVC